MQFAKSGTEALTSTPMPPLLARDEKDDWSHLFPAASEQDRQKTKSIFKAFQADLKASAERTWHPCLCFHWRRHAEVPHMCIFCRAGAWGSGILTLDFFGW